MSSNLDRSLDEILAARPKGGARGPRRATAPAAAVPGGISKRPQRAAARKATAQVTPNATKAAGKTPTGPKLKASKIIVSNLPYDVNEAMIKEYFNQVVGPIKRATLTYGPDGRSRGVATVEFVKSDDAATAAQKYNGVPVDNKPMKVELVVDPNAPASFANRVGAPNDVPKKNQPKPAAPKAPRGGRNARGTTTTARGGRGGNASGSGRGKPKTAEQLDQEMADYFDSSAAAAAAAPAAAPAANADVGMEDTVL